MLLVELHRQGHAIVEEPRRRIVQEEVRTGGQALPWFDMDAFLRRALATALDDHKNARAGSGEWVFFDRCSVDVASLSPSRVSCPAVMACIQYETSLPSYKCP